MSEIEIEDGHFIAELNVTVKNTNPELPEAPIVYDENGNKMPDYRQAPPERITVNMANTGPLGSLLFGLHDAINGLEDDAAVNSLIIMKADRQMILKCFAPIDLANALIDGQSHDINRFQSQAESLAATVDEQSIQIDTLKGQLREAEDKARQTLEDANSTIVDLTLKLEAALEAAPTKEAAPTEEGKGDASKSAGNTKEALKLRNAT